MQDYHKLQQRLGIHFNNPALLQQALTHRSYLNEHGESELADNERLEFLGDAVIDFLAGEMLFLRFPDMPEGDLTRLRAALVRTEALAELALQCDIDKALRMGKGEEASGGRTRPTNLCAGFEAVVGALYLDKGMDAVRQFAFPHLTSLLDRVLAEALDKDARSVLQEWSQAQLGETPVYHTLAEAGPDHEKEFTVEVLIQDRVVGRGIGRSKQAAAQAAARAALDQLERQSGRRA